MSRERWRRGRRLPRDASILAAAAAALAATGGGPADAQETAVSCASDSFWVCTPHEMCRSGPCGTLVSTVPLTMIGGEVVGLAGSATTGTFHVLSRFPDALTEVLADGTVVGGFPLVGTSSPTDVALDAGAVWVCTSTGLVARYSASGSLVSSFPATECGTPAGLAVDVAAREVLVANDAGDVCRYSVSGELLGSLALGTWCPAPVGLHHDGNTGTLWMADGLQGAVCVFDAAGTPLASVTAGCFGITGVDLPRPIPTEARWAGAPEADRPALEAFPNPFRIGTVLVSRLAEPRRLILRVFDVSGKRVATLQDGHRGAGVHRFRWDGRDDRGVPLASGVYFARIESPAGAATRRLIVLRE